MSSVSKITRIMFAKADDQRDEGLTTPEGVVRYDNILYGEDPVCQVLDVYRPAGAPGKIPVIVDVHGGGWIYGDKERYQYYCMDLCMRGFAVVNYTYRLSPEFKFPAQLEDTNTVFHWTLAHAEEYGFDRERIYAAGDSAGAHILGLFCCMCADPGYAEEYDFRPPEGFVPRAVLFNCGAYEIRPDETTATRALMRDIMPGGGTQEELEKADVCRHVTGRFPPTLFMTCSDDFLRDQAGLIEEALKRAGVPYVSKFYGDNRNKLGHVFHLDIRREEAKRCNDEECAFLRGC